MISEEDVGIISKVIASEYSQFPRRLIEDARSERNIAESEQGKYVVELLQNADDAQVSEESAKSRKIGDSQVIFIITDKHMYCANGGYEISREGLDSICRAFLSPKRKNTPVIGYKGIGFKSVLALTEQPEIFWHDGAVMFSREITFKTLKTKASKAVTNLSPDEVPLLRFPHTLDLSEALNKDQILKRLWEQSATIFRFRLKSQTARLNAIKRLKEIEASTILFLNNLTKITIEIDGSSTIYTIAKKELERNSNETFTYDLVKAVVNDENGKSKWMIVSGAYKLPK